MTWQPNKRTGWTKSRDEDSSRLSQVIRAVLEVVPGGVIRAGKETYDDLTAGFWLGIDGDGLAKFHLGNAATYLRWTGVQLEVAHVITGAVRVDGGAIEWAGGKGRADDSGVEHVESTHNYWRVKPTSLVFMELAGGSDEHEIMLQVYADGATHGIEATVEGGTALMAQGDIGLSANGVRYGVLAEGVQVGVQGMAGQAGGAGVVAKAYFAATTALRIEGGVADGGLQRYTQLGDATADADALNRRTADGRYLRKSAGWTGSFAADGQTVTVVDGQIVGVS